MRQFQSNHRANSDASELEKLPIGKDGLPMPHTRSKKLQREEWQEWAQRLEHQRRKDPNYEQRFERLAQATVNRCWKILSNQHELEAKSKPPRYKFMDEVAAAERAANARTALITGIALFARFGLKEGRLTFTDLVDSLAAAFSPHYLFLRPLVSSIRQLSEQSVTYCRRDLLLRGVSAECIWDAILAWQNNPLFRLQDVEDPVDESIITPRPRQRSPCLKRFRSVVESDPLFERWRGRGLRLKIVDRKSQQSQTGNRELLARPQRHEICAERPFNVVQVNDASTELLRIQEQVVLSFDIREFRKDYVAAERLAKQKRQEVLKKCGIRATLSAQPRPFTRAGRKLFWIPRVSEVRYRSYVVALLGSQHYGATATINLDHQDYMGETYAKIRDADLLTNGRQSNRRECRPRAIGMTDPECPYCGQTLPKRPGRKARCPHCGGFIYVRKRPSDQQRVLLTEAEARDMEALSGAVREQQRYSEKRKKYAERLEGFRKWLEKMRTRSGREWEKFRAEAVEVLGQLPTTPEDLWLLHQKSREWRHNKVYPLLNEYDAAKRHLSTFAEVWEQVRSRTESVPIQTRFAFVLNRRFQPSNLWPTHVTSRRGWTQSAEELEESESGGGMDEETAESLRSRWFKWRSPQTNDLKPLRGCDISSSQMQILATLLADEKLEADTMRRDGAFKEYMARVALDCSPPVVHQGYAGHADRRLQNLVKELLMRVSYGSTPVWVAMEQWRRPSEFGPGWTKDGAQTFFEVFCDMYPKVDGFLKACKQLGHASFQRDPYAGVLLRDPATSVEVRWNPMSKKIVHVNFGKKKVYFPTPDSSPNADGEYAVDKEELGRMIMPCLIHMLDAFYSGLVMKELYNRGCRTFVGIHDCWLVPADELPVLKEAMSAASSTWYAGLEPVYDDLLKYLGYNGEYSGLIRSAQKTWRQRVTADHVPPFNAKWDER